MLAQAYDVIVISSDEEDAPNASISHNFPPSQSEDFHFDSDFLSEHRPDAPHNSTQVESTARAAEADSHTQSTTAEEILLGDPQILTQMIQDPPDHLLGQNSTSQHKPETSQVQMQQGGLETYANPTFLNGVMFASSEQRPQSRASPLNQDANVVVVDLSDDDMWISEEEGIQVSAISNPQASVADQIHNSDAESLRRDVREIQNAPPIANGMDSDSDDEIAVLSKEEAERTGAFKASSFEAPAYNQPAPVFHAGSEASSSMANRYEELKIREYFERLSMQQLYQHEHNLHQQLRTLDETRDVNLRHVADLRGRLLNLTYDQISLRAAMMRNITDSLRETEQIIENSKKVRRYRAVLQSVKEYRQVPQHARQPSLPQNFPFQLSNFSFNVVPKMADYYNGMPNGPNVTNSYGTNVNPYLVNDEDSVHLRNLFNDIYKEETVQGMAPTPESLSIQLLDHQRKGLFWLLNKEEANSGCILADDMGLGKTVQTLALIAANKSEDSLCKTTLVVGPVSLLRQWAAEFQSKLKIEHRMKVGFYHGQEKKKLNTFQKMARCDIILTSYTTLASEFKQHYDKVTEESLITKGQNVLPDLYSGGQNYVSPFFAREARFYRIVLDEAQYIKNKLSQTSKATACLKGKHRLCLTGTPMQNSIDELYPILRFLKVRPYDEESKFKRDISVPIKSNADEMSDYRKVQSMKKLRAVLLAIMLRRTKDSTVDGKPLIELPKKEVKSVFVSMDEDEKKLYKDLELGIQKKARKLLQRHGKSLHTDILTLLLRLRQACIHQFLVEVGELNAQEKNNGPDGNDWKRMFQLISSMSDGVKREIDIASHGGDVAVIDGEEEEEEEDDNSSEIQLTCPICLDVVGSESILIFAGCGHMICDGCSLSFFEQQEIENESTASDKACCMTCHHDVAVADLIEFPLYQKVVYDGYTYDRLNLVFDTNKKKKTSNMDKIANLIRQHKGFLPSAKMNKTLDLIKDITTSNLDEKIIVFSHFTTTFDLMGYALKQENIKYLRYDGSMNIDLKNATIKDFYEGNTRVLLLSLKAGNVGLTLTCASHVIIMDPFWNPFVEDQAMDRAHRFGQMKPVHVYKILIRDSVEDRIMDLQERKKELINAALDEKELKNSSHLGRRELGYLFGLNTLGQIV